jgi:hypothetical protein
MADVSKRVMGGAALGGIGQLMAVACSLAATRYLLNGMGPLYSVLVLLIGVQGGLLMLLGNGGQNALLVMLAGDDEALLGRRSRALAAWVLAAAGLAFLAGLLVGTPWVGGILWSDPASLALWQRMAPWAGLAWAFQILCQSLWAAQRARLRMPQAEFQAAVAQSLVILSGPLGLKLGVALESVVEAQALAWGGIFAAGVLWEKRQPGGLDLRPRADQAVFAEAWHIVGWSVLGLAGSAIVMYGDRFFSLQAGANELTAYGLASSLTLRVPSILGLLGPLALPLISAARRDPARAAQLQRTYISINLLGVAAACLPLAAGGAALLGVWGGGKFGPDIAVAASRWMVLLALGGFFLGLSQALSTALIGYGAVESAAWAAVTGAGMGLLAGFTARAHGLPAAAWMAVAGEGTTAVIRAWALERKVLGRGGFGWLLQLLPWAVGGVLGLWLLRLSGFPRWLGPGFAGHLACFASLGAAILMAGLLGEQQFARRRGHASLLDQGREALARRRAG